MALRRVAIIHELRHDGLPGLVAKFFPRDWQVVQNETWSPIGDGLVRGEVSIAAHGAPGSGLGTALLAQAQNGSRMKCNATVEFKVPLVGGKIESVIGRQLAQQFSVITALHREVDHGACLTPAVSRCGTPRRGRPRGHRNPSYGEAARPFVRCCPVLALPDRSPLQPDLDRFVVAATQFGFSERMASGFASRLAACVAPGSVRLGAGTVGRLGHDPVAGSICSIGTCSTAQASAVHNRHDSNAGSMV